jgi:hypothetical protein
MAQKGCFANDDDVIGVIRRIGHSGNIILNRILEQEVLEELIAYFP